MVDLTGRRHFSERKKTGSMRLRARIASLVMAVGIGAVAACGFTAAAQSPRPALTRIAATAARPPAQASPAPGRSSAIPAIEVTGAPGGVKAKGAVLADAATGQVLWGRAAGTELPMASVTKVMTALLVLESGHLGQEVAVPQAAWYQAAWGDSATMRSASRAAEIRSSRGMVGMTPPASRRESAGWVMPAWAASSTCDRPRARRRSRTAWPMRKAR